MLSSLIRSEAAIKGAVLGTFVTLAVSVPVLLFASSAGLGQGPSGAFNERLLASMLLASGLIPALTIALRQTDLRSRADEFRLSLPVPLASLLGARIAALVFAGWLPLLANVSVLAIFLRHPDTRSFLTVRSFNAAAGWLVFVLVLHAVAVERRRLTARELAACILVGLSALAAAAAIGTWVLGPAFFILAGLLGLRVARCLPPRLPLVEDTLVSREPARSEAAGPIPGSVVRRVLLRAMVWRWTTLVFVPLCALIIALSRVAREGPGQYLAILYLALLTNRALQGLLETAHLPLSRRRIFAYAVGPSLLAVVVGLVGGELLAAGFGSPGESVAFEYRHGEDGGFVMAVPFSHWRVSFDGTTPETRVGQELIQPPLYRPVAGLSIGAYNPYAVNLATSAEAAAHQLSRAVREVHGGEILPEELRARYLSHSPASGRAFVDSAQLLRDYPSLRPAHGPAALRWLVLGILWFLALLPALGHAAPPATPALRRWRIAAGWTAAGVLFLLAILVLGVSSVDAAFPGPILFLKVVLERSAALVGHRLDGPLGWLVVAFVYASAYFIHQARFQRIEVPKRLVQRWGGW